MSETYDLYQQGRRHLRKGRAAQATVALEKAKRREPEKASIREALGIAYLRIQRYHEAEEEFRKMLELSPADHYAHYALGRALEKQGKDTEANGHYKLASSLRPQSKHYASRILDLDREEPKETQGEGESGSE
jgi:Flp pilus assembly protein TadD